MKTAPLVLVAVGVSACVSALTASLMSPSSAEAREDPAAVVTSGDDATAQALVRLEARMDEIAAELEGARMAAPADGRIPTGTIEEVVARYLETHPELASQATVELAAAPGEKHRFADTPVDELLAMLYDPELTGEEAWTLMNELMKAGRMDEIVAAAEQLAEENPNDPDAQTFLGSAYLHKVFEVGNSPEAGKWATLADDAFDAALGLDDTHWEARFSKAVSLSHWPAVFGKSGEAIQHFEVLIEQQENLPGNPQFAEPYVYLGSMYQQTGNAAKAVEVWRAGLALYPDNADLRSQVDLADAND